MAEGAGAPGKQRPEVGLDGARRGVAEGGRRRRGEVVEVELERGDAPGEGVEEGLVRGSIGGGGYGFVGLGGFVGLAGRGLGLEDVGGEELEEGIGGGGRWWRGRWCWRKGVGAAAVGRGLVVVAVAVVVVVRSHGEGTVKR